MSVLRQGRCKKDVDKMNWRHLTILHSVHVIFIMVAIPHFSHVIILARRAHYGGEGQIIGFIHIGALTLN